MGEDDFLDQDDSVCYLIFLIIEGVPLTVNSKTKPVVEKTPVTGKIKNIKYELDPCRGNVCDPYIDFSKISYLEIGSRSNKRDYFSPNLTGRYIHC